MQRMCWSPCWCFGYRNLCSSFCRLPSFWWVLLAATVVAAIVGAMSLRVTPHYALKLDKALISQRENREFEALTPGVFHSLYRGRRVTYTESMDDARQNLRNVFIGERKEGGSRTTIWAEAGSQFEDPVTGSRFLLLKRGTRYEGVPGAGDYRVLEFDSLSQRIETPTIERREAKIRTVATRDLLAQGGAERMAEFHWRLALPREGRFARVLPAMGLFILYYLVLVLLKGALADAKVPAIVGLWPAHLLFAVFGWFLFQRSQRPAAT